MTLRVRFAPSPTGYLHVGGARTALFNWLLARKEGGVFVLRIEDTDRERSSEAHTEAILQGMRWLGLDWDEGPYFQRDGLSRHRDDALRLLAEGKAYRDFITPDEMAAAREADPGAGLRLARIRAEALGTDEAETRAAAGVPHAIRFRVPEGETVWTDGIHGEMRFQNAEIEDLVILRSDGTPTYNLAVVSDDAEMAITLVVRGDDHLSNTPKQILLHEALGNTLPAFAHVPMILGPDGKRLSKRHGATAVGDYREQGILPQAMVNFLALLGWNPGTDEERFEPEGLVARFSLDRVQRKSAVFDPTKLEWLNGRHLAELPATELEGEVRHLLGEGAEASERAPQLSPAAQLRCADGGWFRGLLDLLKVRARSVGEIAEVARIYLEDEFPIDPDAAAKHWLKDPDEALRILSALETRLAACPESAWTEVELEVHVRSVADELGLGAGKVIHPLRVALTGRSASPGIFEVLVVLGSARSGARLRQAISRVQSGVA